jgi:predicted enzyme involved in methoxymalonyl-ACP biosynthesis
MHLYIAIVLHSYIFFKLFQLLHTQNDALRCNMSGENEKHMFFQHLVSSIHEFPKNTDLKIKIFQQIGLKCSFPIAPKVAIRNK